MSSTTTTIDLDRITRERNKSAESVKQRVIICAGTGCVANGALKVRDAFLKETAEAGLDTITELKQEEDGADMHISKSGCQGFCQMGPLVTVLPAGILYTRVKPGDVAEIVKTTLVEGDVVERLLYAEPGNGSRCHGPDDIPFYTRQSRTVLKPCGFLDPEDVVEYIANGGYSAARKAYSEMTPKAVCEEILYSGLRGRGGGGFPTGRKWELT
ncbi:MAG TPA: NAD(P)H-dependent oxidoreductase subunit E, partial [Armatimonadota bacterium]